MTTLLLLGLVVVIGGLVQSSIGFGIAVVAAPVVVGVAPQLMPGSLLVLGFALPVLQLTTGPRDIAWPLLRPALGWRLALTPLGAYLVHVLSPRGIAAAVGVLVMVTVALSVRRVRTTATARNAGVAGALTGVSGTAASIGGPFFALVLQHERPVRVRSTLAAFFLVGSAASMSTLALVGELPGEQVRAGLLWLPFLLLGHLLAGPIRERTDPTRMRQAVLGLCLLTSLVVLARAALA